MIQTQPSFFEICRKHQPVYVQYVDGGSYVWGEGNEANKTFYERPARPQSFVQKIMGSIGRGLKKITVG